MAKEFTPQYVDAMVAALEKLSLENEGGTFTFEVSAHGIEEARKVYEYCHKFFNLSETGIATSVMLYDTNMMLPSNHWRTLTVSVSAKDYNKE